MLCTRVRDAGRCVSRLDPHCSDVAQSTKVCLQILEEGKAFELGMNLQHLILNVMLC